MPIGGHLMPVVSIVGPFSHGRDESLSYPSIPMEYNEHLIHHTSQIAFNLVRLKWNPALLSHSFRTYGRIIKCFTLRGEGGWF